MHIIKRLAGAFLLLIAIAFLIFGLGNPSEFAGILDSPDALGKLLGTLIPPVLFGTIGLWLLISKSKKSSNADRQQQGN